MREHHQRQSSSGKSYDHDSNESPKVQRGRKSFTQFMLDSDLGPVVFVGKCVQFFGWGAVAGFFLGSACVYGYALFKPLPYVKAQVVQVQIPITPPSPSPVLLHGFMTDGDNKPVVDSFFVAVVAKQHGPEQNVQGQYTMEVPPNTCYDLMFWKLEGIVNRRDNLCPEKDASGYRLDLRMPLESRAAVQNSKAGSSAAVSNKGGSQFAGQ